MMHLSKGHSFGVQWKPIHQAPVNGQFIALRAPSGYNGTPYRIIIARYEMSRESEPFHDWAGPRDLWAWRDHCGDHLTDAGPEPDAWATLAEVGLV